MAPLGFLALTFSRSMAPLGCLALTFSRGGAAPSGHELEGWPQSLRETVRSFRSLWKQFLTLELPSMRRHATSFTPGHWQPVRSAEIGLFSRNWVLSEAVRLSPTPLVLGKARSTATTVWHNLYCQVLEAALVP